MYFGNEHLGNIGEIGLVTPTPSEPGYGFALVYLD